MKAKLTSSDFPQVAMVNELYEKNTGDKTWIGALVVVKAAAEGMFYYCDGGEKHARFIFTPAELTFLGPL